MHDKVYLLMQEDPLLYGDIPTNIIIIREKKNNNHGYFYIDMKNLH